MDELTLMRAHGMDPEQENVTLETLFSLVSDLRNEVRQIGEWQADANRMLAGMKEQAEGLMKNPLLSQLSDMFG